MNGFDQVVEGEENWFHGHRSLPTTPEQYTASLMFELQKLEDAISMPAENTVTRPWQKTIDFVDGLKGKLPDEKLAVIKRCLDKRSREATQAQVTVTPDTVQHFSPWSPNPEMPSDVCVKLENNEGKMDPERGELKLSSVGTGLETPGQQCPPNEGIWETGRTTANGFLTAGVGSTKGETSFHLQRKAWTNERRTRKLLQTFLRQLLPQKTAGTRHLTKRTSNSTPVEKERRHRLGTRL